MFDITITGKLALFVALPTTFVLLYLLLRHTDVGRHLLRRGKRSARFLSHRLNIGQKLIADNEEEDSKSSKSKSSMTVTEVQIPSYATSAIIGTNRSSLQRLQNSCNVQIDLKQDGDTSSTEDQTLCIRGSLEATQQAELRIQQIISDISTVTSEDMYIPSSSTISLIGNNYQTVRYINRVSGATVLIDTTENRDAKHMQFVSIEGSREQIEHAKKLINDVVDKNLTFHEEPLSQCSSSDTAAHHMHRVAHTKSKCSC
ncbi:uncharacterized protein LOC118765947 [Octopus sinensis]|uniref:Uncharacterized protein LOC118765947 n=1 Tax=Octopus sinensis TaxID=2607531 RepID=A0A7E6FCW6_9MOLL|nr:uncharacterized protein LOC118765947 [Octopus sinensis]